MLSTKLKPNDDPHDVLVAPDLTRAVPTDEELSRLAHSLRIGSAHRMRAGVDYPAPSTPSAPAIAPPVVAVPPVPVPPVAVPPVHVAPPVATVPPVYPVPPVTKAAPAAAAVPPVDTTFRASVGDFRVSGARRAARVFAVGLLLAVCAGAADLAWQTYGDEARQIIAPWTPQRILALLPFKHSSAAQPAAAAAPEMVAATATPPPPEAPVQAAVQQEPATQPAPSPQPAPSAAAPSAAQPSGESASALATMARDLANAGQEIEQLKASIGELKGSIAQLTAGQQQMSRDIAKATEPNRTAEQVVRPKPVPPPAPRRPAVVHRQPPPLRPLATSAPVPTQAAAPYVPRQVEPPLPPQDSADPQADPDLGTVPRPPMPLR